MLNLCQEIWGVLRKNKLRTFLTGFSVAWGIFMLILLLGSGNGLKNGMNHQFSGRAKNFIGIYPGRTTIPYHGLQKGRTVKFQEDDAGYLKTKEKQISNLCPYITQWGDTLSHGKEFGFFEIKGTTPDYPRIQEVNIRPENGRFLNDADMKMQRKVMVIHQRTADMLFKGAPALGQYVKAGKIMYRIVGIYTDSNMRNSPNVYIPLTTAKIIYNRDSYGGMEMTVENIHSVDESNAFSWSLRSHMGKINDFAPEDYNAMYIWDAVTWVLQTMGILNSIQLFIWVIGIGTLIAGIVGVSNIMLISVKERTREFGIRKALGARPGSILKLVLAEATIITLFFGYIGMITGIGLTELAGSLLPKPGDGNNVIFLNPTVEMPIAISATLLLALAGIIAGYIPARKAVRIKPIEALRNE